MSTQHNPEPWPEFDAIKVGGRVTSHYAMLSEDEYNRARACVNACAGIPDYQLTGENGEPTNLGETIDCLREHNTSLQAKCDELLASAESFRDAVLHQRWNLEGNGMTSDQINDVLNLFDTLIGDEIAKAGVK